MQDKCLLLLQQPLPRMFEELPRFIKNHRYLLVFSAIVLVYVCNMFIDVMEIDAAQYALISMEMSFTKSFLHIYQQGSDYLDKPPLLFWLSSLSFLTLGISNFAYKLPSVLAAGLGIYSLYRFSFSWYGKDKAVLSAMILACSQALFLITNDVRTDTLLLGFVMYSVWQLSDYLKSGNRLSLFRTAFGLAAALMAKGPVAALVLFFGFGVDIVLKRNWRFIFKADWIILLAIVAVLLFPMSYGLYTQFDLHPEKFVYGMQGPSGLRFFYWTQSFGRITGESQWNNNTGISFFFTSMLWDFQPWIFLFIPAIGMRIYRLYRQGFRAGANQEFISLGGFILVFLVLSMSKYKLPHYVFVIFPFAAVITADFLLSLKGRFLRIVSRIQFGIMQLFWVLILVNFLFFFPPDSIWLPLLLGIIFLLSWAVFLRLRGQNEALYFPSIVTSLGFNLLLSLHFYPHLLRYQAPSQVGRMVTEARIPADGFFHLNYSRFSLDFYSKRISPGVDAASIRNLKKGAWVYCNSDGYSWCLQNRIPFRLIKELPSFRVTSLSLPFLFRESRNKVLGKEYLIEIE
jgi:4-amino-4-deoxy-L-arabinose transferase-like glycosyltransferase